MNVEHVDVGREVRDWEWDRIEWTNHMQYDLFV